MNDIQLARLADYLREDITEAAHSALVLGDLEAFTGLTRYMTGPVVRL